MSKWTKTPFETLEAAHQIALKLELNPSSIIDTGRGFRSFQTKEGRQRTIIAQKIEGGPVLEKRLPKGKKSPIPLQDPNAPTFGEGDRKLTGAGWGASDHETLDAVRAHYQQLGPSTKHRIAFEGEALMIEEPDGDEVEYRQSSKGVQSRSLMRAGNRTWRYEEPVALGAEVKFNVGPWQRSIHETLEVVEIHWRSKIVNFDNVEVLTVTLYRIGQDEYEYVEDRNTGEVWTRLLRRKDDG